MSIRGLFYLGWALKSLISLVIRLFVRNTLPEARIHDDVIKWKYNPRYWPFVRGIHRSPVNSPYKDQWRGALMFSLICAWINDWANNREAVDLRRHRAHYGVIVMFSPLKYCVLAIIQTLEALHPLHALHWGFHNNSSSGKSGSVKSTPHLQIYNSAWFIWTTRKYMIRHGKLRLHNSSILSRLIKFEWNMPLLLLLSLIGLWVTAKLLTDTNRPYH